MEVYYVCDRCGEKIECIEEKHDSPFWGLYICGECDDDLHE